MEGALSAERFRAAMPEGGLFAEKDWLVSPEAFPLTGTEVDELEKLGHRLHLFVQACDTLYYLSRAGKRPAFIARYLDAGKPADLLSASPRLRAQLPRVLRPDLVLTEGGMALAELDSVPGGIGLTGWLGRTYAELTGAEIVGGADGMVAGFASIFPEGDIVVSDESATYRPEMAWLAAKINERAPGALRVERAEDYQLSKRDVYRFFELFDLPNIPGASELLRASAAGEIGLTPPMKPHLEEKLWLALFWLRPLQAFWRRELHERHWLRLQKVIPYSWVVDPEPLPPHAVLPKLEVNSWSEVAELSQKERELILKISGFSEQAWGSRGVTMAQDVPQPEWRAAVEEALHHFTSGPYLLQEFYKGRLIEHPYFDRETDELQVMKGRVRLCPYFFVKNGKTTLGGAMATICPSDKKLLHGMKDAIIVPCRISGAP